MECLSYMRYFSSNYETSIYLCFDFLLLVGDFSNICLGKFQNNELFVLFAGAFYGSETDNRFQFVLLELRKTDKSKGKKVFERVGWVVS